ncbi:MAG: 2-succinyl-5-enolpyruvyl-6-hydroxy-3-cyclohexene-1-carboxylic-acid synthase [Bacteroidia bacterium]|nr:2-succinyl-5-enolpyruvyl-6-hydroxy-3-cyclohexene-1-carboxylic-acid synthase [Bacteroidia bacterium]
MKRWQSIYDIAQLCELKGIRQAILCPGSRSAPLTLAFAQHPKITSRTMSDERSAAFVALGISQQSGMPTVLVCTSGSAAYNFAPAVAEAFFQQIPLIIFTADRPTEWTDQLDGQTIRQKNIYGAHVKKSFDLPQEYEQADNQWHINRIVNEAINLAQEFPKGPVHINSPFREPLYPAKGEVASFSKEIRVIESAPIVRSISIDSLNTLQYKLSNYAKVLIVAGQQDHDEKLLKSIDKFCKNQNSPLVGDVLSNLHSINYAVRHADVFLGQATESIKKSLQPELLITFGKSVISKQVKQFLRQYKPKEHWHIQPGGYSADTFQNLTHIVPVEPQFFFSELSSSKHPSKFENQKQENYFKLWEVEEYRIAKPMDSFFSSATLGELHLVHEVIQSLPVRCNLHLANSMSVRYANIVGVEAAKKGIHVYANRGTSGIDGCTSTTVGHALISDLPNVLITGDVAFFYDRNAFWHNYSIPNLRVVVLNNHGGIIFNMIDGPENSSASGEYFVTDQRLTAKTLCAEFNFDYLKIDNLRKVKNTIKDFFDFEGRTKILEIETGQDLNKKLFTNFITTIKKVYEA